jgi:hypothetical protein
MSGRRQLGRVGRGRLGRAVALSLALAAMLGQVAGYAHLAFTRHVTCAEHGELVDAGSATTAVPDAERAAHGRVEATGDGDHAHEHCTIAPHRRDRATGAPVRSFIAGSSVAAVSGVRATIDPPRSIALIRLAPKSSPPA